MAFLVGLGWWEGDRFRQSQLILPDQPNEPAMLAMIEAHIPPSAWLVTYNGRGFDWPLLVTRYRMARRPAPAHTGHLDLLPFVRRVFRHRMVDARLRTVETELLGRRAARGRRGLADPGPLPRLPPAGIVEPLVEVVRHNREDVRSLARLLADVVARFAADATLAEADPGDLDGPRPGLCPRGPAGRGAGLSRRGDEPAGAIAPPRDDDDWWLPQRPVDYGGKPTRPRDRVRAAAGRFALDRGPDPRRAGAAAATARPVRRRGAVWRRSGQAPGRSALTPGSRSRSSASTASRDLPGAVAAGGARVSRWSNGGGRSGGSTRRWTRRWPGGWRGCGAGSTPAGRLSGR
jgi:hypothetical protein